jgi:hypothetical protein
MGVKGLMSTILRRQEECVDFMDLVEVARQKGGIEILVDYYSFQNFIIQKIWTGLSQFLDYMTYSDHLACNNIQYCVF